MDWEYLSRIVTKMIEKQHVKSNLFFSPAEPIKFDLQSCLFPLDVIQMRQTDDVSKRYMTSWSCYYECLLL